MKRQVLLCFWALYCLLAGCAPDASIKLEAWASNLHASATITSVNFDAGDSTVTYFADLSVLNIVDVAQAYSNKWLWLESGDTQSVRAYLDSVASHGVDFGTVEIAPNDSLDLKVYWVIPSNELEGTSDELFELALRPEQ